LAGFLIVNPRSGDEAGTRELCEGAERRGVHVVAADRGDKLDQLAREAPDGPIGVAGGDGSLVAVARVCLERGLPFVCVPFGTRNHFARDLGLDRDDPVAALDAFADGAVRRIDVGWANDRPFLNNVSLGVYARLVHRREEHRRRRNVLARLRALAILARHPHAVGMAIDGRPVRARVVLVANNSYSLDVLSLGERKRLDEGRLHVYAPTALVRGDWDERAGERFRIDSSAGRLLAAVDGEPDELETPIDFRIDALALRVLVPSGSRVDETGGRMDNPDPTEHEEEQAGTERHREEEDMRGANEQDAPDEEDADE
jgi:diacylglycerol kinase family enzyme